MANPVYVTNEDARYFAVNYFYNGDPVRLASLESMWKRFNRADPATGQSYQIWYRPTSRNMEVAVDHMLPAGSPPGRYRVETFVPGKHATTRKAIFTVATNLRVVNGQPVQDEPLSLVDMYDLYDVWIPLGEYNLDLSTGPMSGRVRQYDLSLEDPPADISFGPVRWVPLFADPTPPPSGKFDSPVGTEAERAGLFPAGTMAFGKFPVWVGTWFDANPYLSWYTQGYHTGADLNLPGSSDADKGKPIYAIADGKVIFAGKAGSWGNIVVVEHPDALVSLPDGRQQRQRVFSRYGHVEDGIPVKAGQDVQRGQRVAGVGLQANFVSGWHLHFDVAYSDMLKTRPAHWPNMDTIKSLRSYGVSTSSPKYKAAQAKVMKEVVQHYLDPLRFIKDNH